MNKVLHVAVGVVEDAHGRILVALRPKDKHQGGLWEFPGGKIEEGETTFQALKRELLEECNLDIASSSQLIKVLHDYGDRRVLLDVHRVRDFSGHAKGLEDQQVEWVFAGLLAEREFPDANRIIIRSLRLPDIIGITGSWSSDEELKQKLEQFFSGGGQCVQLRAHQLSTREYARTYRTVQELASTYGAKVAVNRPLEEALLLSPDMLHLAARECADLSERPVSREILLGISCHNRSEMDRALKLEADYILLSPVQPTTSHPGATALGFSSFSELVSNYPVPVFALGGVGPGDVECVKQGGGQGVAGISFWWNQ
jgi:8-oxo-dGTP diphosphatase